MIASIFEMVVNSSGYTPIDNSAVNSRRRKVRIMNLKRGGDGVRWKIGNSPLRVCGVSTEIRVLVQGTRQTRLII